MKIFLSYATEIRDRAESVNAALLAAGHDVFFDREDLPAGQGYDDRIRGAIDGSDLFLFLISPAAVAPSPAAALATPDAAPPNGRNPTALDSTDVPTAVVCASLIAS